MRARYLRKSINLNIENLFVRDADVSQVGCSSQIGRLKRIGRFRTMLIHGLAAASLRWDRDLMKVGVVVTIIFVLDWLK